MAESARRDWLYYRIYLTDLKDAEGVLERTVRPEISASRSQFPQLRWFYLRFVDATGPQLRLRLNLPLSELESLERHWDARLAAPGVQRFVKSLYAPEIAKFGTNSAMRFAEELFQRGSELALECLGPRLRTMRTAYGAAVATLLLAGLPAWQRIAFLHQYGWYWSGGPNTRRGGWPADIGPKARRFRTHVDHVLADPGTCALLTAYQRDFWDALRSPARRDVPRSDYFLLFHHLHLTNNRLGVYPAAEAGLARLLWASELAMA